MNTPAEPKDEQAKATPAFSSRRDLGLRSLAFFVLALVTALWGSDQDTRIGLTVEFVEYADTARAVAESHGFSSRSISPSSLSIVDTNNISQEDGYWPQTYRHPGFAYALSIFFRLFGSSDSVFVFALAFFFALWVCAAHLVIHRLYGTRTSILTSLLLLLNPVFIRFFVPGGYAAFLFGTVVLVFLYLSARILSRAPSFRLTEFILLGSIAGLGWHVRYNFSLFLLLFVLVAFTLFPRTKELMLSLLGAAGAFFVATLPFRVWQELSFGSAKDPASIWNLMDGLTGSRPWMQYKVWQLSDLLTPERLMYLFTDKFPYFVEQTIRHFPTYLQYLPFVPFFIIGIFFMPTKELTKRFFLFGLFSLVTMAFILSFFRHEVWIVNNPADLHILSSRYFIWFAPIFLAASIHGLHALVSARPQMKRTPIWVLMLALQLFIWQPLYAPDSRLYADIQLPMESKPVFGVIQDAQKQGRLDPDAILLSNIPAHISWYAGQTTLGLPDEPKDLEAIQRKHTFSGFHFTRSSIGEPHNAPKWSALIQNQDQMSAFLKANQFELIFADEHDLLFVKNAKGKQPSSRGSHLSGNPDAQEQPIDASLNQNKVQEYPIDAGPSVDAE